MLRTTVITRLVSDTPVAKEVDQAMASGDLDQAIGLAGGYLRRRKIPLPLWEIKQTDDDDSDEIRHRADLAVAGTVKEYGEALVGNAPPWFDPPMTTLARMPHLGPLIRTWKATGDDIYAQTALDVIRDYAAHVPIELAKSSNEPDWHSNPWHWCFINARTARLIDSARHLDSYAGFTDQDMVAIASVVIDEVEFGRQFMNLGLHWNGTFAQIKYIIYAALFLPDVTGTDKWLLQAIALWEDFAGAYYYPDGGGIELALGYATSVTRQMNLVYEALADRPEAAKVGEILTRANRFYMAISTPERTIPPFGDLRFGDITDKIARRAKNLYELGNLPDAIVDGTGATSAPFRSWPPSGADDSWAGIYVMRGDWSNDANYLACDFGPWGSNHQHADFMSIHLYGYGRPLIVDPGTCSYRSTDRIGERFDLSHGFLHNTIAVDGVDQGRGQAEDTATAPMQHRFLTHHRIDTVSADYDFWQHELDVQHQRRISSAVPDYWLLLDRLTGAKNKPHQIEQTFQCDARCTVEMSADRQIIHGPDGRALTMMPVENDRPGFVVIGERERSVDPNYNRGQGSTDWVIGGRGWNGVDPTDPSDIAVAAPALVYNPIITCPATLVTVMFPTTPGIEPDVAVSSFEAVNQSEDMGLVIDVRIDGDEKRRHVWAVSYAAHPLTFAHDLVTDFHGELLLIRNADGDSPSVHFTNTGAARLNLAGHKLSFFANQRADLHIEVKGSRLELLADVSNRSLRVIAELAWGDRYWENTKLPPGELVELL